MTRPVQPVAISFTPADGGSQRALLLAGLALGLAVMAWPRLGVAAGTDPVSPAAKAGSYTVVAGDTLDRVIKKQMTDSPLKPEVLRQAFVALNPQAFEGGSVNRLRAGVVLQVPDHAALLRSTLLPVLEGAESAAALRGARAGHGADDRQRWVRFP